MIPQSFVTEPDLLSIISFRKDLFGGFFMFLTSFYRTYIFNERQDLPEKPKTTLNGMHVANATSPADFN